MSNSKHTAATVAALYRAFTKAAAAESRAIEALPAKPTAAQADRCWALAAATNAARIACRAAENAYADQCAAEPSTVPTRWKGPGRR